MTKARRINIIHEFAAVLLFNVLLVQLHSHFAGEDLQVNVSSADHDILTLPSFRHNDLSSELSLRNTIHVHQLHHARMVLNQRIEIVLRRHRIEISHQPTELIRVEERETARNK